VRKGRAPVVWVRRRHWLDSDFGVAGGRLVWGDETRETLGLLLPSSPVPARKKKNHECHVGGGVPLLGYFEGKICGRIPFNSEIRQLATWHTQFSFCDSNYPQHTLIIKIIIFCTEARDENR